MIQIACSKPVLLENDAREQKIWKLTEFTKIGDKYKTRKEVFVTLAVPDAYSGKLKPIIVLVTGGDRQM